MTPPYQLSVADLSGVEHPIETSDDLDSILHQRDIKREITSNQRTYWRVTDADDPEKGEAEWCDECAKRGTFTGQCEQCDWAASRFPPTDHEKFLAGVRRSRMEP